MRMLVLLGGSLLVASLMLAQPKIVVERPTPPPDTTAPAKSADHRVIIDPNQLFYQLKVDSINQAAEEKIRKLITKLEHKFDDPAVEEEVGRLIGDAVVEQQMALMSLQIDRAIVTGDTLLLMGIEKALEELIQNSDRVRSAIERQLEMIERQFPTK